MSIAGELYKSQLPLATRGSTIQLESVISMRMIVQKLTETVAEGSLRRYVVDRQGYDKSSEQRLYVFYVQHYGKKI